MIFTTNDIKSSSISGLCNESNVEGKFQLRNKKKFIIEEIQEHNNIFLLYIISNKHTRDLFIGLILTVVESISLIILHYGHSLSKI